MPSKLYYKRFASAVSKRCGISAAAIEVALPAIFDEIRYRLTEGPLSFEIESFGTFCAKDVPEHEFLYHRGDVQEVRIVPAKRVLKFRPTKSMKNEVETGHFNADRESFTHHPDDPKISRRNDMRYRKQKNYDREKGSGSKPIYNCKQD